MKKVIVIGIALVLGLLLLPACAGGGEGVSQEDYDEAISDLAAAQAQIQSLQDDLAAAQAEVQSLQGDLAAAQAQVQSLQATAAETLAYAEFLDVLMSPDYKKVAIIPRFDFASELEWLAELKNRATDLGDTRLSGYIEAMQRGSAAAIPSAWDYCLGIIEENMK